MSLFLFNRSPEPGETGAQVNALIELDIGTSETGDTVALASTQIFVNGVLAFDAGTFQAGFTGPSSAFSNPQADVLRVVIDTVDPLIDNTEYTIRVVSEETTSAGTLDESYSWSTEDLTGPAIASVKGRELTLVRVEYTEDMLTGAAVECSAENPASYALALVTDPDLNPRLPAVADVTVIAVTKVAENIFDLTVELEPTPRSLYQLTATVCDAAGNPSLAPNNVSTFTGYQPFVDPDRDYDYLAWIPDKNIGEDSNGELTDFILCLQEVGELLLYECDAWPDILDPDIAPEPFLDAMLCDLGYPFSFVLTEVDKRRLVKLLRAIYEQKGTDPGIINAIRLFLGIEVTISSPFGSFGYLGEMALDVDFILVSSQLSDLYTFIVNVPQTLTPEQESRMNSIIDFMKRAPCHWRIEAPSAPVVVDHWQIGLSRLGTESILH